MPANVISRLPPVPTTATTSLASGPRPCQIHPTEKFFPSGERPWTDAPDSGVYAEPRRLCAGCSWRIECLARALGRREAYGVWGGTTPAERARIHIDAILPPILRESTISLLDTPGSTPRRDASIGG